MYTDVSESFSRLLLMLQAYGFNIDMESIIGEGATSVVVATHIATQQTYAAKLFHLTGRYGGRARKTFFNEIHSLRHLHSEENDCIVKCKTSFVLERVAVIILERMDCDLLDLMLDETLLPWQKAQIFQKALAAVQYCHRRGVAHMDLKPENFLCSRSGGIVKLADFGGSQMMDEEYQVTCAIGTTQYAAPEVLAAPNDSTLVRGDCADIWIMGILLHVLLTNTWPFLVNQGTIHSLYSTGNCRSPVN